MAAGQQVTPDKSFASSHLCPGTRPQFSPLSRDPGTPGGGRPPVSTTLRLPCPASSPASSFYDVYQGVRLEEAECGEDGVSVNTTVSAA